MALVPGTKTLLALCLSNLAIGGALLAGIEWSSSASVDQYVAGVTDDTGYHVSIGVTYSTTRMNELDQMIVATLESLDDQFSPARPESDVSRLSQAPLFSSVALGGGLSRLLEQLLTAQRLSNGAFTPYLRVKTTFPFASPAYTRSLERERTSLQDDGRKENNDNLITGSLSRPATDISALPPANAVLYLGNHVIPLAPFRLNIETALNGLRADTLAKLLESKGLSHFWLEMGGIIMVGSTPRTFRLGNEDTVTVRNSALLHGKTPQGRHFWIVSTTGEEGALELEVLSRLGASEGSVLARERGWQVHGLSAAN